MQSQTEAQSDDEIKTQQDGTNDDSVAENEESRSPAPASCLRTGAKTGSPKKAAMNRCVSFGEEVNKENVTQADTNGDDPKAAATTTTEQPQQSSTKDMSVQDEESGPTVNSEILNERRRASMAAFESFRQSMKSLGDVSSIHDGADRWKPWVSWSVFRLRSTAIGCLSSAAVLTIRLLLDTKPTAYLIHSIIVFLDMILIHLFTNSPWLSLSGEIVTIIFFIAFHFTKETVFELLETTFIAILCSFHLILSRNKHIEGKQALHTGLVQLQRSSMHLFNNMDFMDEESRRDLNIAMHEDNHSTRTVPGIRENWFVSPQTEACKKRVKVCGEHFFEHFLDGSAGVMYTSFLGLIIDELITYGDDTKKY